MIGAPVVVGVGESRGSDATQYGTRQREGDRG